ncbi:MAG: UDP-glucuronic acid decarboxylase family protein [Janthinobacterium lividum]
MARAIVTGGAGFLGSHLSDRLLAEGYSVVAVDNLVTGSTDNIAHLADNPNFEYIEQDIIQPYTVAGEVDIIFQFASPASPVDYLELPLETLLVGSAGTHNTLELARQKGAKFLMASTSEVYGDPTVHPQPEEYWGNVNPHGTRAVYDEAKRYSEAVTFAYRRKFGMDAKIVRIFNTYGPRMRLKDGRVVPAFISQALRGEPLTIFGDGKQTRSFCYVSDLIDGIFKLSVSEQSGPINVGNPVERTMIQFAEEILKATGSKSEITYVPLPTADDPKQRRPDITKARTLLGWEPRVALEDGLQDTIAYFKTKL